MNREVVFMSHQRISQGGTVLELNPKSLLFAVEKDGARWQTSETPYIELIIGEEHLDGEKDVFRPYRPILKKVLFTEAAVCTTRPWKTGLGEGFLIHIEGLPGTALTFEALVWVDNCRGELFCELIPYEDPKDEWHRIVFPTAFDFDGGTADDYTLVNVRQGLLLPNDRVNDVEAFRYGQYATHNAYMPWFSQIRGGEGYVAIALTEFDAGYHLDQDELGRKRISSYWMPSLGRLSYRRVVRYTFFKGNYVDAAAVYRLHARETGRLVTLAEKAVRCENAAKLVGCAWVHEGGYQNVQPDSHYYDREHPERNVRVIATFDRRAEQMRALKEKWRLDQVYFHMDGWGVDGYDSHHPDYTPACDKLGGWEGMKRLSDTMNELGYLFATHDQYRDYHYNAASFDEEMAVHDTKGRIIVHSWWLGGKQSYLCSTQAPGYVRRNYSEIARHGVDIKGTYQDVFTICELDECDHPWHRATREDCARNRKACFDYVMAHGIAVSSEEAIDWAMPTLVFCHHAPFVPSFAPDFPKGKSLPLFNLVYHDCFIQPANPVMGPSYNSDLIEGENGFLLALLTASPVYIPIEPDEAAIARYRLCARLQKATQYHAMTSHEYLSDDVQRAVYDNGVEVTINMKDGTAEITGLDAEPICVSSADYGL